MGHRNIGSFPGFQRHADTHNFCIHVVEAGGFQVEAETFGLVEPFEPRLQLGLLGNHMVVALGRRRFRRAVGCFRDGLTACHIVHAFVVTFQQLGEPLFELHLFVELDQRFAVRVGNVQIIQPHRQVAVGFDRR